MGFLWLRLINSKISLIVLDGWICRSCYQVVVRLTSVTDGSVLERILPPSSVNWLSARVFAVIQRSLRTQYFRFPILNIRQIQLWLIHCWKVGGNYFLWRHSRKKVILVYLLALQVIVIMRHFKLLLSISF